MRTAAMCLMAACWGLVLLGCAGPEADDLSAGLKPGVLERADLLYYWRLPLRLEEGESLQRLHLLDENLYCITSANRVIVVDASSGLRKWTHTFGEPDEPLFAPSHHTGALLPPEPIQPESMRSRTALITRERYDLVCFNTLRHAFVMDRSNGQIVRELSLSQTANTGGACDGSYFYFASTEGLYHAISLDEAIEVWRLGMDGFISARPKAYGGNVYVAAENGWLTAAAPGGPGRRIWDIRVSGPITADFHVDDRGLFVGCEDSRLYAMEPGTGLPLWEPFITNGPLRTPVQVGDNTLFQYAEADRFYALGVSDGKQRWTHDRARTVLASMNQHVYVRDAANRLLVINEFTGSVRHIVPLTGLTIFAPNVKAPAIYAATDDGRVVCIRHARAGHLKPEMLSLGAR